jgi:hypothetical protein
VETARESETAPALHTSKCSLGIRGRLNPTDPQQRHAMFVRFVVDELDPSSGEPLGVFQVMYRLADRGELSLDDQARWDGIRKWFNSHLKRPESLSRSGRAHAREVAISWFRDSATRHIGRAREVVDMLAELGVQVEMLRTSRPGYIVYEDRFQVVAEPFRGE